MNARPITHMKGLLNREVFQASEMNGPKGFEKNVLIIRTRSCFSVISLVMVTMVLTAMLVSRTYDAKRNGYDYKPAQFVRPTPYSANQRRTDREIMGGFNNFTVNVLNPTKRTHIAFLKVHKAASSTIQNVLFRFGLELDLSFVLPYKGHYISKSAKSTNPLLPPLNKKTEKYDIICNHAVFNYSIFRSLMYDDAFFAAIVREPLVRFVSAAYYYKYVYHKSYLKVLNAKTMLHDLITAPEIFEPKLMRQSATFNHMALDFGFGVKTVAEVLNLDEGKMNDFVSDLLGKFDFVMIVEYMDYSLVMLKRYLGWSTKDILYIKRNELKDSIKSKINNITDMEKEIFKRNNRLDYLIYEKFLLKFFNQRSKEKDLEAEVTEFRRKIELVEAFCVLDKAHPEVIFRATKFDKGFKINRHDCELMMLKETVFVEKMKQKHKSYLQLS